MRLDNRQKSRDLLSAAERGAFQPRGPEQRRTPAASPSCPVSTGRAARWDTPRSRAPTPRGPASSPASWRSRRGTTPCTWCPCASAAVLGPSPAASTRLRATESVSKLLCAPARCPGPYDAPHRQLGAQGAVCWAGALGDSHALAGDTGGGAGLGTGASPAHSGGDGGHACRCMGACPPRPQCSPTRRPTSPSRLWTEIPAGSVSRGETPPPGTPLSTGCSSSSGTGLSARRHSRRGW